MLSVIIPTLNAGREMEHLLDILKRQELTVPYDETEAVEIIVADSESTDKTVEIAARYGAKIIPVCRAEYDHGGTRNLAWRQAKGDFIFFLTQDAVPVDEHYLQNFLDAFVEEDIVMISGRQIPKKDANPVERLTREFNYPKDSFVRDASAVATMGIKAYFFSDACAVYRRSFLEEMGGFENPIPTNEDMLMAARALKKGYKVGYCAAAQVYHSHNFTLKQQYKRNFDVAAFMEMYRDEICSEGTTGEGIRMVLYTEKQLFLHGHFGSMFRCMFESGAKFLGNRAGRKYRFMTAEQILKKTSNPGYWRKNGV